MLGTVGVAHAALITDCTNQNVGVPCSTSSGANGTCQVSYDGASMTCQASGSSSSAGTSATGQTTNPTTNASNNPSNTTVSSQGSNTSGFVPLAGIPGLTQGTVANSSGLSNFLNNLYKYLIGVAAILAVIMIIWGGLEISTKDSVSKQSDGKKRITQALLGLVLVLSPVLVFSIINPSILNLSLNIPPLNLKTASFAGGGNNSIPTTVDSATGCTVTGTSYLKTASCAAKGGLSADNIAKQWLSNNCSTSFFGLFGANSSSVTCTSSNSSGCLQATVSCEGASPQSYLLMDIGAQSMTTANLEPFDAQTSASLSQFINGCNADGGYVCTNQTTALFSQTSCPSYSTPVSGSASKKCFDQTYYCFDSADANQANSIISKFTSFSNFTNSSNNYICQPNLQFTLQPLN